MFRSPFGGNAALLLYLHTLIPAVLQKYDPVHRETEGQAQTVIIARWRPFSPKEWLSKSSMPGSMTGGKEEDILRHGRFPGPLEIACFASLAE